MTFGYYVKGQKCKCKEKLLNISSDILNIKKKTVIKLELVLSVR